MKEKLIFMIIQEGNVLETKCYVNNNAKNGFYQILIMQNIQSFYGIFYALICHENFSLHADICFKEIIDSVLAS